MCAHTSLTCVRLRWAAGGRRASTNHAGTCPHNPNAWLSNCYGAYAALLRRTCTLLPCRSARTTNTCVRLLWAARGRTASAARACARPRTLVARWYAFRGACAAVPRRNCTLLQRVCAAPLLPVCACAGQRGGGQRRRLAPAHAPAPYQHGGMPQAWPALPCRAAPALCSHTCVPHHPHLCAPALGSP
jgi:hypothetical protein